MVWAKWDVELLNLWSETILLRPSILVVSNWAVLILFLSILCDRYLSKKDDNRMALDGLPLNSCRFSFSDSRRAAWDGLCLTTDIEVLKTTSCFSCGTVLELSYCKLWWRWGLDRRALRNLAAAGVRLFGSILLVTLFNLSSLLYNFIFLRDSYWLSMSLLFPIEVGPWNFFFTDMKRI